MKILALDIATRTGWATNYSGEIGVGFWELATKQEITAMGKNRLTRRRDCRIMRLRDRVSPYCGEIDCIVIEDVEFSSSRMQCQLWSSLRAAVWLACEECNIHYEAVNVKTLKKWATGNGNADKNMMIAAARRQRPYLTFDEDSADAFHLLTWAEKHIRL